MSKDLTITLNSPAERDAILAGLRLLQRFQMNPSQCGLSDDMGRYSHESMRMIQEIAEDNGEPLDNGQIDALCERINA